MNNKPSTGYEGEKAEIKEPGDGPSFDLVKQDGYSRRVACSLKRNGEPIGIVYLENDEEFEWLRDRIKGRMSV